MATLSDQYKNMVPAKKAQVQWPEGQEDRQECMAEEELISRKGKWCLCQGQVR